MKAWLSKLYVQVFVGLVLLLGVGRVMNEARAVNDLLGNGVATIAAAKCEGAFDRARAGATHADREAVAAEGAPRPETHPDPADEPARPGPRAVAR